MHQIGRYEVEREIGRGAMGVVYVGVDPKLKRRVAIKTVLPSLATPEQPWDMLVKRLEREAQAAASLSHPNIIAVHDIVQAGDLFCVVMEFVDGRGLVQVAPPGFPSTPEFAVRVLRDCAAGLDHAHARGVVHRDIKPGNIMLDRFGAAKIADFGIAKLLHSSTDLTRGFAIGTLEYMSPEQINAMPVDGRADQYALAAVAYRLLTGSKIYDTESIGPWCHLVMSQPPSPATKRNPELPGAVDAVLERGMAKKAEDRYATCSKFVEELVQALSPKPIEVRQYTIPMPPPRAAAPSPSSPIVPVEERPLPAPRSQAPLTTPKPVDAEQPSVSSVARPRGHYLSLDLNAESIDGGSSMQPPAHRPSGVISLFDEGPVSSAKSFVSVKSFVVRLAGMGVWAWAAIVAVILIVAIVLLQIDWSV